MPDNSSFNKELIAFHQQQRQINAGAIQITVLDATWDKLYSSEQAFLIATLLLLKEVAAKVQWLRIDV